MPWISRSKLDALQAQASLGLDACLRARRESGKLANVIHRQRCYIKKLKAIMLNPHYMMAEPSQGVLRAKSKLVVEPRMRSILGAFRTMGTGVPNPEAPDVRPASEQDGSTMP